MSYERTAVTQPRLLPDSLEQRLLGMIAKCVGVFLISATLALALSLLTWSIDDPSLTHATSGKTRNLLGPFGAIVSDLLIQTLGLAGAISLLPLVYWATQLITDRHVESFKLKVLLAPVAILLLSTALAALPKLGSWPLHHGFGGILGDVNHKLFTSLLGRISPTRAPLVAGILSFGVG
jgi:S-DNA-T family DNA segregation ATPase FtsK/SpoIIIE